MVLLKAKGELAQLTDIPPEEQVLITSNGEYLSQFKEDEKTIGQISEVFLFDRRIMKSKIDLPCLEFEITESTKRYTINSYFNVLYFL